MKSLSRYIYEKPIFLTLIREIEGEFYLRFKSLIKGKVLDFGCGDGFFAKEFIRTKIDTAFDIEPKINPLAVNSGIYKKVIIGKGSDLPFGDNTFDTVISNCVLEHIPNLKDSLDEIGRVLKPGGYFIATVMEKHWDDYLLGTKFFGGFYSEWMRHKQVHYNLLSVNGWIKAIEKAGMKVETKEIYLTRRLSRTIDLFHYLGIGDLLTHKIFKKWVIFPSGRKMFPLGQIIDWGRKDIKNIGGALFIIARKI